MEEPQACARGESTDNLPGRAEGGPNSYAGHAFFDPRVSARSGILFHNMEVSSGADLAAIGHLPRPVFFNSCEVQKVLNKKRNVGIDKRIERAAAFPRGGVANSRHVPASRELGGQSLCMGVLCRIADAEVHRRSALGWPQEGSSRN